MSPVPQEHKGSSEIPTDSQQHGQEPHMDGVVISGMSGLFPKCNNVDELSNLLYAKENPVTSAEPRWTYEHPELPKYLGIIPDVERFDAQFFKVVYRLGHQIDARCRKLLEQAYQAIYDAGVSPADIWGKKVGVFMGTCFFSEQESTVFYDIGSKSTMAVQGCSKSMFANRISYWLNLKGPSICVDASCSSSMVAFQHAYDAIKNGDCEAAIVGGSSICLHPEQCINYGSLEYRDLVHYISRSTWDTPREGGRECMRLRRHRSYNYDRTSRTGTGYRPISDLSLRNKKGLIPNHIERVTPLCMDGKTKSFDKNADGCARSEAITVLFLQKAQDAKRNYAEVCHIENQFSPLNNDLGHVYGPYRDSEKLTSFIRDFYKYAGIHPASVEYLEAFGSGVPEADKSELEAISKALCKEKKDPLLVGSVASNIGNTEAASGICSIIKVLLGYHTGQLAANLHCDNPRDDVEALREGRMRIVTKHENFRGSKYAAVNNISNTGINMHLLLKGPNKSKDLSRYQCKFPYLVALSGRQESGVQKIINSLKTGHLDPEQIGLLHNVHEHNISGHLARGFVIVEKGSDNKAKCLIEKADYYDDTKRPLWFLYSGMGSQWTGMGTELMRIPIFAASMERLQKVIKPKGIDIVQILTSKDPATFDNILNSFVGITAVQIGLTDVLREIGIVPDNVIGHSAGESGCAYADGCLTAEETILSTYYRGLVSLEGSFIHGTMAAVGLGYKQIKNMCPQEIDIACHNSSESSTISGPSDVMSEFVDKLTSQGIFAKKVSSSNIAYHSRYISKAGPTLLKYLKGEISNPKVRSEKWLSTSVPQDRWNEPSAKLASAEYTVNNMINPVLFEETSALIPPNAVVVEIAPHGLMQAIVKRSLPDTCINISLTKRGHPDNALFLLEAIGKLYMQGFNPRIKELYPKIEFPVSSGTPFLSNLVEWAHEEIWDLPPLDVTEKITAAAAKFTISLHDDEHSYLKGHVHGKETLYPFSGALVCVWDTLAMSVGATRRDLSVQFHDVHLHEQPRLHNDKLLRLDVQLQRGNGFFEVMNENTLVVSGKIFAGIKLQYETLDAPTDAFKFVSQDVYKMFHRRGSYYSGEFKSIKSLNEEMNYAQISWTGNWITFLDSMLQLNALRKDYDGIVQPKFINRLDIDIKDHLKTEKTKGNDVEITFAANLFKDIDLTRCGGVAMKNIKFKYVPPLPVDPFALKALKFTPFFQSNVVQVYEALNIFLQIAAENTNKPVLNVVEIQNSDSFTLQKNIEELVNDIPGLTINFEVISQETIKKHKENKLKAADLVVVANMSTSDDMCKVLYEVLPQDIFVINSKLTEKSLVPQALYRVVASAATTDGKLELARWRPAPIPSSSAAIFVNEDSDLAILHSTKLTIAPDQRLIILSSNPLPNGLKELVQKWRRESKPNKFYVAIINIINNENLEEFPVLDLAFNVIDQGTCGGNFYINLEKPLAGPENNIALRISKQGDMDSLYWENKLEPESNQTAVTVHYTGLNVRDAKKALGIAPFKPEGEINLGYGMDFSGTTASGERVMGVIRDGAASSCVAAEPLMLWPVPAHWTLEDAATVPLPYAQAFYCIGIKSQLLPSTSLLVHGATGALGLAIISIALAHGCETFATVSDVKKKRFLRRMFPNLPDDHIGNSRTDSFGDLVMEKTKGRGCNIVVSCLEGELKNLAIRCCALSGVVLDTHQIACGENYQFGMFHLTDEKSYLRVDFSSLFNTGNRREMEELQLMLCEGIKRGYVKPLPRVTYETPDVKRAFNLLAASRHRGRVLLHIHGKALSVKPRLAISPQSSHLIITAAEDDVLKGKIVDVLIKRGAKNIILHRQQGKKDTSEGYNDMQKKIWKNLGVQIRESNENLVNSNEVDALINDCNRLAAIEGVYFIASGVTDEEETQTQLTSIINNLDLVTRKLCPKIKVFTVVSDKSNIGEDICIKRSSENLPSTMLKLPRLNKFADDADDASDGWTNDTAVEAIEQAVQTSYPVLMAHTVQPTRTCDLLKRLSDLTGLKIQPHTSGTNTLEKLGLDINQSKIVSQYLEEHHDVHVSAEKIPKLSISRIREYAKNMNTDKKTATGLNVVFNYIDNDVLLGTHDYVFIPTTLPIAKEGRQKFEKDETYLVLVPGIEGHHNKFHSMCERLKLQAVVLQPGLDHINETVEEMAARLVGVLLNNMEPKKKFYLLGYSFGVLVALEMAAILEKQGQEGVVFCVDASPETFPTALDSWLSEAGATDDVRLQDAIVQHIYGLMAGDNPQCLQLKLDETQTWSHKVEAGVNALRDQVTHSSQYVRAVMETTYARIKEARRYDVQRLRTHPLHSLLVVLRSSSQPTTVEPDLGLSRYSVRAPQVYNLSADHAHALDDLRCANIVNKHLDKDILDAYKCRNLCETYLLL